MTEFTDSQNKVLEALHTIKSASKLYQINTIGNPYNPEMAQALTSAYSSIFDELTKDIGESLIRKYKMLG